MNSITRYPIDASEAINRFLDTVHDLEMTHTYRDLFLAGIDNGEVLYNAIQEAIRVLHLSGHNPEHHIKHIFLTDIQNGHTTHEWKMSRLGFTLTILSADGNSLRLNRTKIEIIRKLL